MVRRNFSSQEYIRNKGLSKCLFHSNLSDKGKLLKSRICQGMRDKVIVLYLMGSQVGLGHHRYSPSGLGSTAKARPEFKNLFK